MSNKLASLTSLRFFASLSIVIFHMQGLLPPASPNASLALGVSFFFVLSGFILTYAHGKSFDAPHFYLSRFARLWPLHIFCAIAWLLILRTDNVTNLRFSWADYTNFFLLQAWIPTSEYVFSINPVSWSLSAEVFFYAVFPLLRGKYLPQIFIAVAIVTLGILIYLDIRFSPSHPDWRRPDATSFRSVHAALQLPLIRLLEFCAGVAAARMFIFHERKLSGTVPEGLCLALVLLFALTSDSVKNIAAEAGWFHLGVWYSQAAGMLIFAASIYVFAQAGGIFSRVLQWRGFVILGEISFSTYLVHMMVLLSLLKFDAFKLMPNVVAITVYLATRRDIVNALLCAA